jgi:uncharacterized protein (DUF608 family)
MKQLRHFIIVEFILFVLTLNIHGGVDGTMGTPLGGIGTGGIRFSAYKGIFHATESAPCSMDGFKLLNNAGFMLYTSRDGVQKTSAHLKSYLKDGHLDDDAMYPLHNVNFSGVNSVDVKLLAFTPICFDSINLMCLPYAFFEITLTNTAQTDVEAAVGLQIPGTNIPVPVPEKGIQSNGSIERAIYASSSAPGAIISTGNDSGFFTTGQFNNTPVDSMASVAVKLTVPANSSKSVQFVYSWYNTTDTNRYFYTNLAKSAGEVADIGLSYFNRLRDNAAEIVTRMRASNFPDWIKDHTLNSLCNLTSNSIYTKDGRHCFTEGMFDVNGTMDQMWHARQIMIMTVPELVWKELEWWARTQKTNPPGQIHHDMGYPMKKLWGWDDQQHAEYDYQPDCNAWVDLNCAFIISVYEAYCATADKTKLDFFWPYVKKAGQAIRNQVLRYGDPKLKYTFTSSLNSYDQAGIDVNAFNASISTTAYKILSLFSEMYQDSVSKRIYQNAFDTVRISFKTKYLSNNFTTGRFTESFMAGQWIGMYLKFDEFYDPADIDYALATMDGYYNPLTNGLGFSGGSYNEWSPYLISHYGGLCLQTGRFEQWRALQYDWYQRNYLNRNRVFNQELGVPSKVASPTLIAEDPSVFNQYISVPVLWRNYYTMLGYFRNKSTGELWLEPIIPPEMNHKIKNGFYMSPEGYGTISVSEEGEKFYNQKITFKPDRPIQVTSLYLHDKSTGSDVKVSINGIEKSATRLGEGYTTKLKVDYSGSIDSSGIVIDVTYGASRIRSAIPSSYGRAWKSLQSKSVSGYVVLPQAWSGKKVSVRLYTIQGRLIARKIIEKPVIDIEKEFNALNRFLFVKADVID